MRYEIPLDVFRKLNPKIMERYLPFFREQMKYRRDNMSDSGWVNGLYVGRAISSCFLKNAKYPEEPLRPWNDETLEEDSEHFTDADRFAGFAAAFNRKFE